MPTQTPTASTPQSGKSWYTINKSEATDEATIRIYEDIGMWGITAQRFTDELEALEAKTIHVRINTNGGDVFDGIAIGNALKAHPATVIVHVDSLAASAGSVIAIAGDEVRMADNAYLMIHEVQGGVFGQAADMRQQAELLDKLNNTLASTYQQRAGKTRQYWRDKIADETWFTADEAKTEGLIDAIEANPDAPKNKFDFAIYNHAPDSARKLWAKRKNVKADVPDPDEGESEDDFMRRCQDAGGTEEECQLSWDESQQPDNQAPEPSQRSDAPPVISTQESTNMADTSTVAPAQAPAAPSAPVSQVNVPDLSGLSPTEIGAIANQWHQNGATQGRQQERERFQKIVEACPGKPQMAVSAFLSGQTPEAVKLAFDATAAVEADAQQRMDQLREDNRRAVALAAAGGYTGGVPMGLSNESDDDNDRIISMDEAKTTAADEWDRKPAVRKGYSSKENYVAYRARQLTNPAMAAR